MTRISFARFAEPDRPSDLRANANSSYELVIEWKPPINPNGVVTHYIVFGSWQRYDQDYIDKHDPCAEREPFFPPLIRQKNVVFI